MGVRAKLPPKPGLPGSPCLVTSFPGVGKGEDENEYEDDERGKASLLANITLSRNSWPVIGRLFGWQPEAGA